MKFVAKLELLLIGMWLGAACFFSFGVAPTAFRVFPTGELAGNLVNRTLMIVNISGFLIGLVILAASFVRGRYERASRAWASRVLLFIMTIACAAGHFVISFWLAYLRLQIGKPVGDLAPTDPMKLWFDQLHRASVWVLITAMISAVLVFLIIPRVGSTKAGAKEVTEPDFDFSAEFKN